MIEFQATYFNGKTSQAHPVNIFFDGRILHIRDQEKLFQLDFPLEDFTISPPLGKTRRFLKLPDGARCETNELSAIDTLERIKGVNKGMRIVHVLESHWKAVTGCILGIAVCVWAFTQYGIPILAERIAYSVPLELAEKMSGEALKILDRRFLKPSELPTKKADKIKTIFRRVSGEVDQEFDYRLEFRKGHLIGANALALPSGLILVTDELVEVATDDRELAGIFMHEISHVRKRHALRSIVQNSGVFLLISALVGDIASISSTAASIPTLLVQSGYSKGFEQEADREAGLYLIRHGWGTKPYQNILLRISKDKPDFFPLSVFSSHPETKKRIKDMQALERSMRVTATEKD